MQRAQQWLSAREQLISGWFSRAQRSARAHLQARATARAARESARAGARDERRLGGAGAIVVPFWWEYESELKRRIALETLMRRLFSLTPAPTASAG